MPHSAWVPIVTLAPAASSSVSTGRARGLPQWVPQPIACLDTLNTAADAVCRSAQFLQRAGYFPVQGDSVTAT